LKDSNFKFVLTYGIGFLLLFTIISCTKSSKNIPESLQSQALSIATEFAGSRVDSATVITDSRGIITIGDELVRYVINPENVFHAELDERSGKEVLVTIDSLHDPYLMPAWHLVLRKDGEEIKTIAVIRSDMRVLSIDNQTIVAEIPIHSPSSPLYYCSECHDTVKYQIIQGRLVLLNE